MGEVKAESWLQSESDLLAREPDESRRETARRIISAIDGAGYGLDRAVKWQQLVFTLEEDYFFWVCALGFTKKSVGLTFHAGSLLEDPTEVLVAGTSKFMRKIHYHSPEDVDVGVIQSFVRQSVENREAFKVLCKAETAGREARTEGKSEGRA